MGNAENSITKEDFKSSDFDFVIDVRSKSEYDQGHYIKSLFIPHTDIKKIESFSNINKNARILLYCRSGNRAGQACNVLKEMGYDNVKYISGSFV
jgi:rhodanese-related sulfurtransferase